MLVFVVCFVLATAVHEYAHAVVADRLGDPTPGRDGRVTLNPVVHADPIGTIALPLLAGLTHGAPLGWGRPVMTQPRYYTRKLSMRAGMALVSLAGPLSNLLQALLVFALVFGLVLAGVSPAAHTSAFAVLGLFAVLNVLLALFNLLPVHPLDGGKILAWALPARWQGVDDFLSRYGWILLLVLMFSSVLGRVLGPVMGLVYQAMHAVSPAWLSAYGATFRF